jgi:hypothetical protein
VDLLRDLAVGILANLLFALCGMSMPFLAHLWVHWWARRHPSVAPVLFHTLKEELNIDSRLERVFRAVLFIISVPALVRNQEEAEGNEATRTILPPPPHDSKTQSTADEQAPPPFTDEPLVEANASVPPKAQRRSPRSRAMASQLVYRFGIDPMTMREDILDEEFMRIRRLAEHMPGNHKIIGVVGGYREYEEPYIEIHSTDPGFADAFRAAASSNGIVAAVGLLRTAPPKAQKTVRYAN